MRRFSINVPTSMCKIDTAAAWVTTDESYNNNNKQIITLFKYSMIAKLLLCVTDFCLQCSYYRQRLAPNHSLSLTGADILNFDFQRFSSVLGQGTRTVSLRNISQYSICCDNVAFISSRCSRERNYLTTVSQLSLVLNLDHNDKRRRYFWILFCAWIDQNILKIIDLINGMCYKVSVYLVVINSSLPW